MLDEENSSNKDESLYESEGNGEDTDGEQLENLQNYTDNIKLDIKKDADNNS